MATEAQIAANRANGQKSTGPRTPEGKMRCASNAALHGLFSASINVRPEEADDYEELRSGLLAEFAPAGILEHAHAMEIVSALWRLRRCNQTMESAGPAAIDRARVQASNALRRSTAELRRLQTERHLQTELGPVNGLASHRDAVAALASDVRRRIHLRRLESLDSLVSVLGAAEKNLQAEIPGQISDEITKQTQFAPRNSLCLCGSGKKYKRCCIGMPDPSPPATSGRSPPAAL